MWHDKLEEVESIKNFFGAINKGMYFSYFAMEDRIRMNSVPFRTEQPVSDGKSYYKRVFGKKFYKLEGLECDVFMLSSGKLALWEIIQILLQSQKYKEAKDMKNTVFKIYEQLDKEFLVVWKPAN